MNLQNEITMIQKICIDDDKLNELKQKKEKL